MRGDLAKLTGLIHQVEGERREARRASSAVAARRRPAATRRSSPRPRSACARRCRAPRRGVSGVSAWPTTCCDSPASSKASTTASSTRSQAGAASPTSRSSCRGGLSLHMDVKFPLDNYMRYLDADLRPRARAVPRATSCGRAPAGQGGHAAATTSTRRRHRRLRAAVHPERAGVRVHPRAGPHDPRRRAARQGRVLLAAHAVRRARGDPPGGRQLPAGAHVRRDPRRSSAGFQKQWDKFVDQMDKVGARLEDRGEGIRASSSARAATCSSAARQDRGVAGTAAASSPKCPTSSSATTVPGRSSRRLSPRGAAVER